MSHLPLADVTLVSPATVSAFSDQSLVHPGATPTRPPRDFQPEAGEPLPPILVAEDDADDAFFIQRLIRKTGVKNPVKVFDDGTEVVNFLSARAHSLTTAARRRTPLLLFLDLKMKGLGGFGFLEWARGQKDLGPITIVVLSNSSEPEDMQRAIELGAHRYLVKYPSVQTFATIVASVYPQRVF